MRKINVLTWVAASLLAACGGSSNPTDGGAGDGGAGDAAVAPGIGLAIPCSDPLEDLYKTPAMLPAFDDGRRGEVVRCAKDRRLSAMEVNEALKAAGYVGDPLPYGVTIYKAVYRTVRVTSGKGPKDGLSAALILLPDETKLPTGLVVAGHGSVGLGPQCGPSREDQLAKSSTHTMNLAVAASGLITIAPDYAGLGYGATHGWSLAEDEAHSVLDATRAMKRLLKPENAPAKVVLVGHSQGGHAVLSAQAWAGRYGLEGSLVGVVGMAPLWLPGRTWGAALSPLAGLNTKESPGPIGYSMIYFYGHGELYDGDGAGVRPFAPAKQKAIKDLLATSCLDDVYNKVKNFGDTPADIYDPAFLGPIAGCSISDRCDAEPAKTWVKRMNDDRPPLDGAGAPVVVFQGRADGTISPDRAQCGFEKMQRDLKKVAMAKATLTLCGDKEATHGSVIERNMAWVVKWATARLGGGPEPAACTTIDALKPDGGGDLTCPGLPPNDKD